MHAIPERSGPQRGPYMIDFSIASASSDGLLPAQSAMNRSTRGQWQMYGSHRQQIERLIVPPGPDGRACVLGAGNCNDLDLHWMMQVHREVHLVDLDTDALAQGVGRQQCHDSPRLRLHAPVDLSAVAEFVSHWKQSPPNETQIFECLRRMEAPTDVQELLREPQHLERPGGFRPACRNSSGFDLVLSPCVLSQLLIGIRDAIGSTHPRYPALRAALRRRHIQAMVDLLAPGAKGVLVIDLACSEDFPDLASVPQEQAADLMRTLIQRRKCFTALTPAEMSLAMRPFFDRGAIISLRLAQPWIWHLGLRKSLLVYAIVFDRGEGESAASNA
jgi:hypothetical protein